MGIASEIENRLARLRGERSGDGAPVLRTSTMTHLVWAPPSWLPKAKATLAGLRDSHPARTIFLVPERTRVDRVQFGVSLHPVHVDGGRDAYAEVIELRLGGDAISHPASLVLPLLISDLPVFCRWRGEPAWDTPQLVQLTDVADRLVVDSSEWRGLPDAYVQLATLFPRVAVSDIAFSRSLHWRARLAGCWPGIKAVKHVRVQGPRADGSLLVGWLRSRLDKNISWSRRAADAIVAVWLDGDPVEPPRTQPPGASDLLSAELDVFGRDPIYEAALKAASFAGRRPRASRASSAA
jgi:Glucose-6-phosphate dehydrogenase subunit N-terminal domain